MNLFKKSIQAFAASAFLTASPLAFADAILEGEAASADSATNPAEMKPLRPSLEGVWKTRQHSFALTEQTDGFYVGRLTHPNACGVAIGEEVIRGYLDEEGAFSGEIQVCTEPSCPDATPRWIYFLAIVSVDGQSMTGTTGPTTYMGCDQLFRGFQIEGQKTGNLASVAGVVHSSATEVNSNEARRVTNAKACALATSSGYLELTDIMDGVESLEVDGVDWLVQPTLRPVSSGIHQVLMRFGNMPPERIHICIPGGKTPFRLNITKAFNLSQKKLLKDSVKPKIKTREVKKDRDLDGVEDACPRNPRKTVPFRITNSSSSVPITDVYVDGAKQGGEIRTGGQMKLKLSVGPHTIRVSTRNGGGGSMERIKSICVGTIAADNRVDLGF